MLLAMIAATTSLKKFQCVFSAVYEATRMIAKRCLHIWLKADIQGCSCLDPDEDRHERCLLQALKVLNKRQTCHSKVCANMMTVKTARGLHPLALAHTWNGKEVHRMKQQGGRSSMKHCMVRMAHCSAGRNLAPYGMPDRNNTSTVYASCSL